MAARQAPQVSLKSPYSVWTPSRENLWRVSTPFPALQVVQVKSQSGEPDMATYRAGQTPQHRVILWGYCLICGALVVQLPGKKR